jgi:hypothetical protein
VTTLEVYLRAVREPLDGEIPHVSPTRRILLVGEDNPQSVADEHALYPAPYGCAGHRLQSAILAIDEMRYLSIWRTNLCLGERWSAAKAHARAEILLGLRMSLTTTSPSSDTPWRTIVILGSKVAGVFSRILPSGAPFEPFTRYRWAPGDVDIVALPHPSGRCQVWNDRRRAVDARQIMRAVESVEGGPVCGATPWGELVGESAVPT